MPPVTVREATAAELTELGRLTVAAYVASGDLPAGDPYLGQLADPGARADSCDLLVATTAGSPLGGADGRFGTALGGALVGGVCYVRPGSRHAEVAGPDEVEIRTLAVLPAAQGRGVGAALVTACLDRARTAGVAAAALCVVRDNAGAHRLYRRFGFTRAPERDWRPNDRVELQAYRLALGDGPA